MDKLQNYEPPQIEVLEVKVEQGFANSLEDINRNTPIGW